ncbi:MAG: hypothetical protein JXD21_05320 [Candidatus Omnitrophica bacterium]|nr:hypothetical protein [Candidatus Omnitrophota bacterium]
MKKIFFGLLIVTLGCGYTTKAFRGTGSIYVKPVQNNIRITQETRAYSSYQTYPILIEKKLTNAIVDEFRLRSNYTITSESSQSYTLECSIISYTQNALQYSDSDDVTERRLRLHVKMRYLGPQGELLKERTVVGEATYYLQGLYAKSESEAFEDLIDDTSRRIVESIADDW